MPMQTQMPTSEEQDTSGLRVNDKRRFDMDGNVRTSEGQSPEEATAGGRESVSGAASGSAPSPGPGRDPVIDARSPESPPEVAQASQASKDARSEADEEANRLKGELETARRRIDELARAYQSGERDREEFKQRLTRERELLLEVERGKVALMVIESIDELDLCLQASGSDGSSLAQGVRLIRGNLLSKVQAAGIEQLELVGQPYDPNFAEAVDMEMTDDPKSDGAVVSELRAGYRMKNRVIRPARVKIAKYVKPVEA